MLRRRKKNCKNRLQRRTKRKNLRPTDETQTITRKQLKLKRKCAYTTTMLSQSTTTQKEINEKIALGVGENANGTCAAARSPAVGQLHLGALVASIWRFIRDRRVSSSSYVFQPKSHTIKKMLKWREFSLRKINKIITWGAFAWLRRGEGLRSPSFVACVSRSMMFFIDAFGEDWTNSAKFSANTPYSRLYQLRYHHRQ